MRIARAGLPAALVLGALVLSFPAAAAAAEDDGSISISEQRVAPGATVTVTTTACGDETYGKGESEAGGPFHLLEGDRKGVLVGEFRVPDDAESGSDTVTLKCPPRTKVTGTYQISGRPSGAVEAGFGDATGRTAQFALGGVLLTGAVAGAVARTRRRTGGVAA
ncbi:sortase [Streptomyces peucetius]|uniref:Sortase n=1 Tax=Streptomyces peucetius TaxID=1950 RepID=A0ABY6IEZ8_STRPE|nr:sortase [Streptomyces peucetius]UYQ65577.1 sortase [Streptomyces peucetius]